MARGWESKSVEAQQDAASAPRQKGPPVTREQAARNAERSTLTAHRAMLEQAVADLDRRLAMLG
jgi:hypothetical protein